MWRYFLYYCQTNKITNMSNLQEKKEDYILSLDNSGQLTKMDIIEQNLNAIDFGYELCKREYEEKLRWIPVEESKPKKDKKRVESDFSIFVLVKDIHGIPQSAYYNFKKNGFYSNAFSENEIMCVTHWRYIFL